MNYFRSNKLKLFFNCSSIEVNLDSYEWEPSYSFTEIPAVLANSLIVWRHFRGTIGLAWIKMMRQNEESEKWVSITCDEVPRVTAKTITDQLSWLPPAGVIWLKPDREYLSFTSSIGTKDGRSIWDILRNSYHRNLIVIELWRNLQLNEISRLVTDRSKISPRIWTIPIFLEIWVFFSFLENWRVQSVNTLRGESRDEPDLGDDPTHHHTPTQVQTPTQEPLTPLE